MAIPKCEHQWTMQGICKVCGYDLSLGRSWPIVTGPAPSTTPLRRDAERVFFIREAAIALIANNPEVRRVRAPKDAEEILEQTWVVAKALWAAKPEDC